MKVAIDVKDRNEAARLKAALADPEVRAFALIVGALLGLPSDRARRRVLRFVTDEVDEAAQAARPADYSRTTPTSP